MTPAAECIVCDRVMGPEEATAPVCESCQRELVDRFSPPPGPATDTMARLILLHLHADLAAASEATDLDLGEVLPIETGASRPAAVKFGSLDDKFNEAMQRVGRPIAVFAPNLEWGGTRGWFVLADSLDDESGRFWTRIVDAESLVEAGCTFPKNAAALYDRDGLKRTNAV